MALEASDFHWVPRGADNPPAACFRWPSVEKPEVEIEFLTPKRGSGEQRIVSLQDGLTAQTLWHLDILLRDPLSLTVDESSGPPDNERFQGTVRVRKLGHFLIQKGLIHRARSAEGRIKDLFYVFDVIDSENGMSTLAHDDVVFASANGWQSETRTFVDTIGEQFASAAMTSRLREQYPPEKQPSRQYVEKEALTWSGSVLQALDRSQ